MMSREQSRTVVFALSWFRTFVRDEAALFE